MEQVEISYDRHGRMQYHPEFHFSHGKSFTESDLEYICKFYDFDNTRNLAFAIGKTEHAIRTKVAELRTNGLFDYYKNLNKHW